MEIALVTLSNNVKCNTKIDLLWWMKQGLSYTASGYGKKIPTQYKINLDGRWLRVYCCTFSNSGSLYVVRGKENLRVEIERRKSGNG